MPAKRKKRPVLSAIYKTLIFLFLIAALPCYYYSFIKPNQLIDNNELVQYMIKANTFTEVGIATPRIYILKKLAAPEGFRVRDKAELDTILANAERAMVQFIFAVGQQKPSAPPPKPDRQT